jgi:hypothetical protein
VIDVTRPRSASSSRSSLFRPSAPKAVFRDFRMWPIASFRCRAGRFREKADIERQAQPAASVEIDPERTFVALLVISKTALHKPM